MHRGGSVAIAVFTSNFEPELKIKFGLGGSKCVRVHKKNRIQTTTIIDTAAETESVM